MLILPSQKEEKGEVKPDRKYSLPSRSGGMPQSCGSLNSLYQKTQTRDISQVHIRKPEVVSPSQIFHHPLASERINIVAQKAPFVRNQSLHPVDTPSGVLISTKGGQQ